MNKRPAILFYPSDWLKDTALRSCSIGARGLWVDMLCYMHEGNPYGYLKVNQKVIHVVNLASMSGLTKDEAQGYLDELYEAGVYSITDDGTIYSRRMVKDEEMRIFKAECGKMGGNPKLSKQNMDNQVDKVVVNHEDNQKQTSSSSSSKKEKEKSTTTDSVGSDVDNPVDNFNPLYKKGGRVRTGNRIDTGLTSISNILAGRTA